MCVFVCARVCERCVVLTPDVGATKAGLDVRMFDQVPGVAVGAG